jgi:ATP synthase protein I
MVGAFGWLIVTPTLIGVFVGRWLDGWLDTGVTFSGALTFLGACLGFWMAWKRMNEE